jgi:hypothetical protein
MMMTARMMRWTVRKTYLMTMKSLNRFQVIHLQPMIIILEDLKEG